ncbi:acyltransferase [Bradyrhizobium sp.]|uniref:acyltransferase family protein n=1 Tax=Bradyrhizobium sp. TaxID=376 RepID=UPI002DDD9115|nr:acyltransferase [Bradyrhizobium sp.]HEV2154458.1 acyltransferase [Bradyrhizobium sp.]
MTIAIRGVRPADAAASKPRTTILSVQVMRGLAAVAVAIFHAQVILARSEYGSFTVLPSIATKGWLGVNFFFVLSGFIIMFAHANDVGRPDRIANYVWKRFSRVYPVYWIFLTFFLAAAYRGIGHPNFSWDHANILTAYALMKLSDQFSLPLQVAWTLFYEVTFYAVFIVLLVNRTVGIAVLSAWMLCVTFSSLVLGNVEWGLLNIWNAYFVVGMLTYLLYRKMGGRWALPLLIMGTLLLLVMLRGYIEDMGYAQMHPWMMISIALPFAMILLGCVLAEQRYGWKPPRLLLNLGDATYAIYLVHSPAITMLALLNYKFTAGVIPPMALFVFTCVGSVAAGVLAHVFVERPILGFLKGLETRDVGTKVAAMGRWLGAAAVQSARGLAQSRYIARGHHVELGTAGISRSDLIKPA